MVKDTHAFAEQQLMAKIWEEHKRYNDAVSNKKDGAVIEEIHRKKEELIKQLKELLESRQKI
ncbi:MAG TPA: hypothetical protein VGI82_06250 [Chitinophagaceae bacterium]|jgi:K+/H+ antiporter YhaU regulatory subunit KhtT